MRLASLDVFRGLTVVAMIFVNFVSLGSLSGLTTQQLNPQSWIGKLYLWIDHAPWHGSWRLADFVFPFFLHIVGVAMAFSLAKYNSPENRPTGATYRRIFQRVLLLVAIGLLLNGLVYNLCKLNTGVFNFATLRWLGVLQRIGLAYGLAAVVVLLLPPKGQWLTAIGVLLGYWCLLGWVPAPDAPVGHFLPGAVFWDDKKYNFSAYVDRLIIPTAHLHAGGKNGFDPEGVLSTFPAMVSVLLGYFNGLWLKARRSIQGDHAVQMAMYGLAAIVVGSLWHWVLPINKVLWTSSYVVYMAGWALVVFALCYYLVDVRVAGRWVLKPLEWTGLNALFAFVGSILMIKLLVSNYVDGCATAKVSFYSHLSQTLFGWAGVANSVVLFALVTAIFWQLLCYWMYRCRWFIKL
jgi:predicted acyltransferase